MHIAADQYTAWSNIEIINSQPVKKSTLETGMALQLCPSLLGQIDHRKPVTISEAEAPKPQLGAFRPE